MNDLEIQSAVNTLLNWGVRRESNGKAVSRDDVLKRINDLWPETAVADAKRIVAGVLSCLAMHAEQA